MFNGGSNGNKRISKAAWYKPINGKSLQNESHAYDSLESAIAWRKSNVDTFRSKSGRICSNIGVRRGTRTATYTHAIDDLKKKM